MSKKALYALTAFLSGLCVMGVETSATRLLSPSFGNTNVIWAVIISLILIGLALGSLLGGRLADRSGGDRALYRCIAAAGLWVCLLPLLSGPVLPAGEWLAGLWPGQGGYVAGVLLCCLILFVPPLLLLGIASPYLAKLCVLDLAHTGAVTGRLSLLNTLGSILGSVLPTFVLIPWMGVQRSFLAMGGLLLLLYALSLLTRRARPRRVVGTAALALLLVAGLAVGTPSAYGQRGPLYATDSAYQHLRVDQYPGYRALSAGKRYYQSIRPDAFDGDEQALSGTYYDLFTALPLALENRSAPTRVLLIGYGGGVIPSMYSRLLGAEVRLTSVELDPEMVRVAQEYLSADPQDTVVIDDGRHYLRTHDDVYDIILVDVYADAMIPQNLATQEFFELCARRLAPGGLLAMNLSTAMGPDSPISMAMGATAGEAFASTAYLPYADGIGAALLCSEQPLDWMGISDAAGDSRSSQALLDVLVEALFFAERIPPGGEVITDDRCNAERIQLRTMSLLLNRTP